MLDQLVLWEREAFLWFNSPHTPFLDSFMYLISARWTWTAVVVALIAWVFWKRSPREAILFILAAVLMITISDQVISSIIKPLCSRPRPTHHIYTMEMVKSVYNDLGGGFGFVSGHAANFFAIAMFTALAFRDRLYSIIVFTLALVVAYSRVYLGMHFLSDIIPGSLLGIFFGWLFFKLYRYGRREVLLYSANRKQKAQKGSSPLSASEIPEPYTAFSNNIAAWKLIMGCYIFFLLFFAIDMARVLTRIGYYETFVH